MKRIFLIDCPGIVPPSSKDTETDILFKGVVRVENVSNPEQFIPAMLSKCKKHHLERTYEIRGWDTSSQFLEMIARRSGKLLKGGEPDETSVAKMVLNDFNRGKIPWFVPPPLSEDQQQQQKNNEENEDKDKDGDEDEKNSSNNTLLKDRTGRLGEMKKRKPTTTTTTTNNDDENENDDKKKSNKKLKKQKKQQQNEDEDSE